MLRKEIHIWNFIPSTDLSENSVTLKLLKVDWF